MRTLSSLPFKVSSPRGPSAILAKSDKGRLTSKDGLRWAIARFQKRSLGNGRFDAVECWTLWMRVDGKAVRKDIQRSEEEATKWISE